MFPVFAKRRLFTLYSDLLQGGLEIPLLLTANMKELKKPGKVLKGRVSSYKLTCYQLFIHFQVHRCTRVRISEIV